MRALQLRLPLLLFPVIVLSLVACVAPQATAGLVQVNIQLGDAEEIIYVASGSSVQDALDAAGIQIGELDRVMPPSYTVITEETVVGITRITERFEVEDVLLAFERQTLRNESLPEGDTRLLQPGENGLQQITYRIVEEEGVEVSRSPVKSVVLYDPKPEIVMIGSQASYIPIPIEGTLVYASAGNAWMIRTDTGNRTPLVVSGDLDGRVFKLSPDAEWLLFTRQSSGEEDSINSLWVVSTVDFELDPIDLEASNIIHFADWSPMTSYSTIAYSTAEPSPAAPGWQANNDLVLIQFSGAAGVESRETILEPNVGGQYGWWGTSFAWAPNGERLAYSRADGIGVVDLADPSFRPVVEVSPFQTLSDWAWVPGIAWGADSQSLFFVDHGQALGAEPAGASPLFDLVAISSGGQLLRMADRTGMFAYPSTSRVKLLPSGEQSYQLAFLQAVSPLESDSSRYRLVVMDRDGSNREVIFPPPGDQGVEPQSVVWSPSADRIVLTYRGDLWIVEVESGEGQRLTGDGQTMEYDWKP